MLAANDSVALLILSYALIELLDANYALSLTLYSSCLFIMLGLEQIAIGMSDPFGDDDVDFPIKKFIEEARQQLRSMIASVVADLARTETAEVIAGFTGDARVERRGCPKCHTRIPV